MAWAQSVPTKEYPLCHAWRWIDIKDRKWLVLARNKTQAEKWAFEKIKKRAKRFAGMAKLALGLLMKKSGSKTAPAMENQEAASKAQQLTTVERTSSGGRFSLSAHDMLDYAKLALKGGEGDINTALMKASNKVASVINQRCKKLLLFEEIPTPFPEVVSRK